MAETHKSHVSNWSHLFRRDPVFHTPGPPTTNHELPTVNRDR
jgi:hypothetical protein